MTQQIRVSRANSVANEPIINRIPILNCDSSHFLYDSVCHITLSSGLTRKTPLRTQSEPTLSTSSKKCTCPHILICDDESFQHLLYANFFSHMIDYHTINIPKEELKISMHTSGEDLTVSYQKTKSCGCGKLKLVITDFYMGSHNMNGMDTVLKLRELGFGGTIILRTSDAKQELLTAYPEMERMLKNKLISCFLDKTHLSSLKTALPRYL